MFNLTNVQLNLYEYKTVNLQDMALLLFKRLAVFGEQGRGGGDAGLRCNKGEGSFRTKLTQCFISTMLSMEAERGNLVASKSSSSISLLFKREK